MAWPAMDGLSAAIKRFFFVKGIPGTRGDFRNTEKSADAVALRNCASLPLLYCRLSKTKHERKATLDYFGP